MNKYLILLILFVSNLGSAQLLFYSDCLKGGIVGDGYTSWVDGGQSQVYLPIPVGCSVRKAFFFSNIYKWEGNYTNASDKTIEINNQPLILSESYSLNFETYFPTLNSYRSTIAIDITNYIDPLQSVYTINPFSDVSPVEKPLFSDFYILVIYENSNYSNSCVDVYVNDKVISPILNYNLNVLNPLVLLDDIGLAVHTWGICDNTDDWYNVQINGTSIGQIGGQEDNTSVFCAGVVGSFFYQNGELFGTGNDLGNNTMNGLDAIANIQSYISNQNIDLNFEYVSDLSPYSNSINQLFLSYTSPCNEFPTQTSIDTTLCQGSTAQLFASGGQAYSWQPATGLSCTDCPNPIVTADSSRLYTVRIWNNDSCSVVRPIKVNVQPLPQFSGVGSTPTACGENTGSAIAVAQNTTPLPLSYSINGAPFAFSSTYTGNFANLSAGANTIILRDAFGCETDTVIQIGVTNTTNAFFTATPNSGAAPLSVSFTNQSTNATNYNWFIESDFVGDNLLHHTFDTSGSYTVTLIAWQNDPLCADTFSIQIVVYDSLIIQIPNVFTPNGDGINDQFTITTNQPVTVEYQLFNRWGNVIAQDTKPTTAGNSNFVLPIWDGADYSDGTYFYVIRVVLDGKEYEFDGFLERVE